MSVLLASLAPPILGEQGNAVMRPQREWGPCRGPETSSPHLLLLPEHLLAPRPTAPGARRTKTNETHASSLQPLMRNLKTKADGRVQPLRADIYYYCSDSKRERDVSLLLSDKKWEKGSFPSDAGGKKKNRKNSCSQQILFFILLCFLVYPEKRSDHLRRFLKTTFFLVIRLIWRESPSWVSEEAAVWPPTNGLRMKWSGWDPASSGDPTGWAQLGVTVGETKPGKSLRWKLCAGEP